MNCHRTIRVAGVIVGIAALTVSLGGCAAQSREAVDERTSSVSVQKDVRYRTVGDQKLRLNACLPPITREPSSAIVLVHGGGFERGSKDNGGMVKLCKELANEGFAAFNVNYRLAPKFSYPAPVDDVAAAVEWLRRPEQVTRFGIDPQRIGLFGSSAGAIVVASVGTAGDGSTDAGSRVSAVVALSPAVDFTPNGFALGAPADAEIQLVLQYLGCTDVADCPNSKKASPLYSVDASDPSFFIAASSDEIVPIGQAKAMQSALTAAGVPVELEAKSGKKHGVQLLDDETRARILTFLHKELG
ncbi:MAG: hypothetical protein JWQ68_1842 [Cryobacterium sp.]|jgi:acetyl esterase|nr:hypothetical protein [Cryobacterium sp.]